MPARKTLVALAFGGALLLWLWLQFAEPWLPSLTLWACVAAMALSLLRLLLPARWVVLGSKRFWAGCLGIAILGAAGALGWPAAATAERSRADSELDRFMPEFDRRELHARELAVPCETARRAAEEVQFSDIRGLGVLFSLRAGRRVAAAPRPLLATMTGPTAPFLQLASADREFVAGNVGRPWKGEPPRRLKGAEEYAAFHEPGFAKVAFNLRFDSTYRGGCRVSSETRVFALSGDARTSFTRYWRLIYPGSALIRVLWLDAIERRLRS